MDFYINRPVVYPKVKVRGQHDQDDQLVFPDFLSAEKAYGDISAASIAKVPRSYRPNATPFSFTKEILDIVVPKISGLQEKESEDDEENSKQKCRASSVLRPRAVLSSPDNDQMIGNRNRFQTPKNRKIIQNRHRDSLCKVVPKSPENSVNTQKPEEGTDDKTLKGRRGSVVAAVSGATTQRLQART